MKCSTTGVVELTGPSATTVVIRSSLTTEAVILNLRNPRSAAIHVSMSSWSLLSQTPHSSS